MKPGIDAQTGDSVPEADRLEQEQPTGSEPGEEQIWPESSNRDLDEGDLLEQAHAVVPDPDEDYQPDPG